MNIFVGASVVAVAVAVGVVAHQCLNESYFCMFCFCAGGLLATSRTS